MSKPRAKKIVAGVSPGFDERSPAIQKKQFFAGGNPAFDERKIVQAAEKIAVMRQEQEKKA
jgi:hypothetical protein